MPTPETLTPSTTLAEFLSVWLDAYVRVRRRAHTLATYRNSLINPVVPVIGAVPLGRLTVLDVQRALDVLALRYEPATVRLAKDALASSLRWAVGLGIVDRNVAASAVAPGPSPITRRALDAGEARRLVAVLLAPPPAAAWYAPAFLVALLCGLRRAELQGLRWQALDLPEDGPGVVRVYEQLATVAPPTWSTPKGTRGVRALELPAFGVRVLRSHRDAVAIRARQVGSRDWPDLGLAFPTARGRAVCGGTLAAQIARVCRLAAVPPVGMHELRHTYATRLRDAGVSLSEIQQALGHQHMSTTVVYLHQTAGSMSRVGAAAAEGLEPKGEDEFRRGA